MRSLLFALVASLAPFVALAAPPTGKAPATKPAASSASASSAQPPASASVAATTDASTGATIATTSVDDAPPPPITDAAATPLSPAETPKDAPSNQPPRATWHPDYAMEIEAHLLAAGLDQLGPGLGAGARISVPVAQHAPFTRIDDDLSLGIGIDYVRYAAYKPLDPGGPTLLVSGLYVPLSLQWNVWFGARASFFVEPTIMYRFATYVDACNYRQCADTNRVLPTGAIGVRVRISDHIAGTFRVGWPLITMGASWL